MNAIIFSCSLAGIFYNDFKIKNKMELELITNLIYLISTKIFLIINALYALLTDVVLKNLHKKYRNHCY